MRVNLPPITNKVRDPFDRHCDDWVETYLHYGESQESPQPFHLWCGLSTIAAALERRIWLDKGYYKLYPNVYVILVGGSASVRKSTAIGLSRGLFVEALPFSCVFSQKITTEALISTLNGQHKKTQESCGYVVADELSVFLGSGARDSGLIQILTKLYDCTNFDYHTVGRGEELCDKPCCNMLGGTTPEWMKYSLPEHSVGGGFTGRVVFVYQLKSDKRIAFPQLSNSQKEAKKDLLHDLQCMASLKGTFSLSPQAINWYDDWYQMVFDPDVADVSLRGYFARKHDTLLKVAMLMAVSRGRRYVIEEADVTDALEAINENEKHLAEIMRWIQATPSGEETRKVLAYIKRQPNITYSRLLRGVSYLVSSKQLLEIIESLLIAEVVTESLEHTKKGQIRTFRARGVKK